MNANGGIACPQGVSRLPIDSHLTRRTRKRESSRLLDDRPGRHRHADPADAGRHHELWPTPAGKATAIPPTRGAGDQTRPRLPPTGYAITPPAVPSATRSTSSPQTYRTPTVTRSNLLIQHKGRTVPSCSPRLAAVVRLKC